MSPAGYLAEVYAAHLTPEQVVDMGVRARAAAAELTDEGTEVAYSRAIYLPADETCFYLFEAGSVAAIEAVTTRAGLVVDRIVPAVEHR
jgi:hypothetical protein